MGFGPCRRDLQRRSQPQDRYLRSKTLAGAPGGSILGPRTEDLASRGPRILRSRGPLPPQQGNLMFGPCRRDLFVTTGRHKHDDKIRNKICDPPPGHRLTGPRAGFRGQCWARFGRKPNANVPKSGPKLPEPLARTSKDRIWIRSH